MIMENLELLTTKVEELTKEVVILKTEGKAKDREIKEIKEQLQKVSNSQMQLESTNQIVLNELKHIGTNIEEVKKNVTDEMKPIKDYIESLKTQPKKDMDKFKWWIVGIVGSVATGLIVYLATK